jgi:hypothetical protein
MTDFFFWGFVVLAALALLALVWVLALLIALEDMRLPGRHG